VFALEQIEKLEKQQARTADVEAASLDPFSMGTTRPSIHITPY
jgi:hypothetical protein